MIAISTMLLKIRKLKHSTIITYPQNNSLFNLKKKAYTEINFLIKSRIGHFSKSSRTKTEFFSKFPRNFVWKSAMT